jgi:AraC-like DNA-binding protein
MNYYISSFVLILYPMLPVSLVCPFLIALRFSLTFILAVVDAIRRYLKKIFTATFDQFMLNVITIISQKTEKMV